PLAFVRLQRSGAGTLDFAERAHVDDAVAFAKCVVLGSQPLEVRRSREAEGSLVRAGPAPWPPSLEVVRPLPTVLDAEDRTQVLHPRVERACPARPSPL